MADTVQTLEELRKAARKLESAVDMKLLSYSKFGTTFAHNSLLREDSAGDSWQNTEHMSDSMSLEIEQLLMRLSELNDQMSRCIESSALPHIVQHHRAKLHDYVHEFKKTKDTITQTRQHAELIISVQNDISKYNNKGRGGEASQLRTRGMVINSNNIADAILETAEHTKNETNYQNELLHNIRTKLDDVGTAVPGIKNLISAIQRKKTKDCIILSFVISFCLCFLLFYWLRS